ncbi:PTS transporter subunit EIIB [Actinotalea sp. M2MS4P-6]|uniref:PTS transporter subunit EIIB n=1 Tax=Actinotalea sp. M2MS4P-6 TaxID=2983762 RepID=UPI0021E4ACCE|nr:PTS transporter subunit EIIB [Actinotalea sp. M2MS4P-6]MCV2395741.1 PTS transporter subunit EIIB [Actinotalea sp. M2MS4P-6]
MTLVEALLEAVGGRANVASLTRCWARLRFELHDPELVDQAAIDARPEVVIAVHQHGQFQVALRSGLLETFDGLTDLLR